MISLHLHVLIGKMVMTPNSEVYPFIYSTNMLNAYYVLSIVLDAGNIAMDRTVKNPYLLPF